MASTLLRGIWRRTLVQLRPRFEIARRAANKIGGSRMATNPITAACRFYATKPVA